MSSSVTKARGLLGRSVRSPIVQIAAVAALVYVAVPKDRPADIDAVQLPIRIAASDYESGVQAWEKVHGTPPTDMEKELILDRLAADEALFRRALELGLDETPITDVRLTQLAELIGGVDEHGSAQALVDDLRTQDFAKRDPIMRSHLIQTMKLVARKVDVPPGHELVSFYATERDRFARPPMYEIRHVYFSSEKRGASARKDAEQALTTLETRPETDASTLGDRFNAGSRFSLRPEARIRDALGEEVTSHLNVAPPEQWVGPLQSPYGWHLVRVEDAVPAQAPQLATISSEVLHTYLRVRGEEKLARTLRDLRLRYGVEVDEL